MNNLNPCFSVANFDSSNAVSVYEFDLIHQVLQHCDPMLRNAAEATPAYLMSAKTFGAPFDKSRSEFARRLNSGDDPSEVVDTEYLAVFTTRKVKGIDEESSGKGKKIFLCPERIQGCAKNSVDKYQAILLKVFLHEWMHAAMHVSPNPILQGLPRESSS